MVCAVGPACAVQAHDLTAFSLSRAAARSSSEQHRINQGLADRLGGPVTVLQGRTLGRPQHGCCPQGEVLLAGAGFGRTEHSRHGSDIGFLHFAEHRSVDKLRLAQNTLATWLFGHKLHQQGVALERQLDHKLPNVRADAAQIGQVFLNLALNAMEAMSTGGTLTIVSRAVRLPLGSASPQCALIQFRDTGHGMSREQCDRVFTSLLGTTKQKGTGLGLAIVAKIIEAHQGKIRVRSRQGNGTTFTIVLPLGSAVEG